MAHVKLYTTPYCPYCMRAKQLLKRKGIDYEEINVMMKPALRREMENLSGRKTVPQIWINDFHVGGCDELYALETAGRLDALLKDDL